MPKERSGCIVKKESKLYVRVTYHDSSGKRHELMRRAKDKKHAKQLLKQLLSELNHPNKEKRIEGSRLIFSQLAEDYKDKRLIPPVYQQERKIAGLRSWKRQHTFLKPLIECFGSRRVQNITPHDIESYKLLRLKTPTIREKDAAGNNVGVRSIANVNHTD
jgi:hypothetical protein